MNVIQFFKECCSPKEQKHPETNIESQLWGNQEEEKHEQICQSQRENMEMLRELEARLNEHDQEPQKAEEPMKMTPVFGQNKAIPNTHQPFSRQTSTHAGKTLKEVEEFKKSEKTLQAVPQKKEESLKHVVARRHVSREDSLQMEPIEKVHVYKQAQSQKTFKNKKTNKSSQQIKAEVICLHQKVDSNQKGNSIVSQVDKESEDDTRVKMRRFPSGEAPKDNLNKQLQKIEEKMKRLKNRIKSYDAVYYKDRGSSLEHRKLAHVAGSLLHITKDQEIKANKSQFLKGSSLRWASHSPTAHAQPIKKNKENYTFGQLSVAPETNK